MTREWVRFFIVIAVMVVSASIAVIVSAARPTGWGSIADWTAAFATAGAAGVALFIASNEAKRARETLEEVRRRDVLLRSQDSLRILKAMLTVLWNGVEAIKPFRKEMLADIGDAPTWAQAIVSTGILDDIAKLLSEFSLSSLPSSTSVDLLMTGRAGWMSLSSHIHWIAGKDTVTAAEVDDYEWKACDEVIGDLARELIRRGYEPDITESVNLHNLVQGIRATMQTNSSRPS